MKGSDLEPRGFLERLFRVAIEAARPDHVGRFLPPPAIGRTVVVGAGKASGDLAAAFEKAWRERGRGELGGAVVVPDGQCTACEKIEIIHAEHPVPSERSLIAARRMLELVQPLGAHDEVVALISGGGSSLLCLPPDGIGLELKKQVNRILLESGATVAEMNCVRKHLSLIKGGRLAVAAHPARVHTIVVSDIPRDDLALVASGPTLRDSTTRADALEVIERYRLDLPRPVIDWIRSEAADVSGVDDLAFARDDQHLLASSQICLEAAAQYARRLGVAAHILSDSMEGEARDVGRVVGSVARQIRLRGQPTSAPCVLLSGGEATVTVKGQGRGGRNAEFALAMASEIEGLQGITVLAADTDGIDGSEDNAGAFCDGMTTQRLLEAGIVPRSCLANNDAYTAFARIADLFVTGPTGTNVNDFRAVYIA